MELGYSSMKPEQVEVAVALIEGRDVFAILPTGFGKSLCYACLPVAFDKCQKKERGYSIVVVVSPLVAIMKDQEDQEMDALFKHLIIVYILKQVSTYSIKGLKQPMSLVRLLTSQFLMKSHREISSWCFSHQRCS